MSNPSLIPLYLIEPITLRPSTAAWSGTTPILGAWRAPHFLPAALFENHFTWWFAALALGIVLWLAARSRNDGRLLVGGQVILAATLLWIVAAQLFDSPAERLYKAHRTMADAASHADVDTLFTYIAPSFTSTALDIQSDADLASAKSKIAALLKQYGIKDSTITSFHATLGSAADRTAFTQFTVLTRSDMGPLKTSWNLSWNDDPASNWKMINATLTKLGDQPAPSNEVIH